MNEYESDFKFARIVATAVTLVLLSVVAGITGYNVNNGHVINDRIESCVTAGGTWDETRVGGDVCEMPK